MPRVADPSYRDRERAAYDAQPLRVACLFCEWSMEGVAKETREEARRHRLEEHPNARNRTSRRRTRRLSSFRAPLLSSQDWQEIEEERRRRSFLVGIDILPEES